MSELKHYGVKRRSGRYPWGSGGNAEQRGTSFLGYVKDLEKKGMKETDIAKGLGISTSELRRKKSLAKAEKRKADMAMAIRLKEKGMSNVAIGERMGINESSVRSLLDPKIKDNQQVTQATANVLRDAVKEKKYLDIGVGTEHHMGISRTKLKTAVQALEDEGYKIHYLQVEQLGTGKQTSLMVLTEPGVEWSEVNKNKGDIRPVVEYSKDGGRTYLGLDPVQSVSSDRLAINYAEDGGTDKDGVIELRRGVDDISLGNARYAQVRIGVDDTHYLKGMAVYADDLPDGVDIRFNTNKSKNDPKILEKGKLGALKDMKDDPDNPFGASIKKAEELRLAQKRYIDKDGKEKVSAINVVYEEGDWDGWSRNLASQMLSKQRPSVAKKQLDIAYDIKKQEYEDIMSLTNPSVKKVLLEKFADGADAASVHLKAAALPRQSTHVLLPIPGMKENEIYAPNFRDGDSVVLVRYPHGGIFEIPRLTVNNKIAEGKRIMGKDAPDAVGIHPKKARQMSGADHDGDTALVIPDNNRLIKTGSPLKGLEDFDPSAAYPAYKGMKKISPRTMQMKMGDVSNLITDMTIKGATNDELARAVRHSMVVIDSEKHNLNYKQSHIDNGIGELKKKYQGGERSGAATLISRASSEARVPLRKEGKLVKDPKTGKVRRMYVDPKTGKKLYEETPESYINKQGKEVQRTTKITKMEKEDDAFNLSSGTPMETVYATYANRMKSLAKEARKQTLKEKPIPYSSSAKKTYAKEVQSLDAKLKLAVSNKPKERQAQLLANTTVSTKRASNPNMDAADLKRLKGQALEEARTRVNAKKQQIKLTPREWEAIQAGAISGTKLNSILSNSDLDTIKQLATPRTKDGMSSSKKNRAKQLLDSGYTTSEVADSLGVSPTVLKKELNN